MRFLKIILLTIVLHGCKESDESKINKASSVVFNFVSNMSVNNYSEMLDIYPRFRFVKNYYKLSNFNVVSNNIMGEEFHIIGNAGIHSILFVVQKKNDEYLIKETRGLSSDIDTYLYSFCKRIGCIDINSYDVDISINCEAQKQNFNSLVSSLKKEIEQGFLLIDHTLKKNGVIPMVSGEVTVKNTSRFSLPKYTYEVFIDFMNDKDDVVFTSKIITGGTYDFKFNNYRSYNFLETGSSNKWKKFNVNLRIVNVDFIRQILANHAIGENCNYSSL